MNDTKAQTFDELSPIEWLIKLGREEKQPHTLLLDRAAVDLVRITAENVELKRLLIEQVGEHGWTNGGDYPDYCGTCENTAKQGHKADCKLAAALKSS